MEVDFDNLCQKAFAEGATIENSNDLWQAVFQLESWHFIPRERDGNISPYVAESYLIEPETYWLYSFTDSDRAVKYAKDNGLENASGLDLFLSIPNNQEIITFCEKFLRHGVKGIHFNAGEEGFYAPLQQLSVIRDHLKNLNKI